MNPAASYDETSPGKLVFYDGIGVLWREIHKKREVWRNE